VKKILLIGENPFSKTGNGNMMAAILMNIDMNKYQVTCFVAGAQDSSIMTAFQPLPYSMINAQTPDDNWGANKLLNILQSIEIDVVVIVGIDIWQYGHIFEHIYKLKREKRFKWVAIFPYDLQQVRRDWVRWINLLDYSCVYSQYGLAMLKNHVPKIRYFKPLLYNSNIFQSLNNNIKMKIRHELFPTLQENDIVFGFVGVNSFRKDIPKLLKAFMQAKQEVSNIKLYLHVGLNSGVYNLKQMAVDYNYKSGDLLARQGTKTSFFHMARIYNIIDCLVNCTMQEGLSWTILEAMLCGTPVIASDTTAQTELVKDVGLLVPCEEQAYIPVKTESGQSFVDAKACKVEDIKDAIVKVAKDPELRESMRQKGLERAKEWLNDVSDINALLVEVIEENVQNKIRKVLFMQHSSAGDVLMSTQCFKGIKERHKDMELCYMTQSQYTDIIEGNPYIDKIVLWDPQEAEKYEIVYNPHEEHILHGGFNSLDVTLYSMYPYFCKVEPDEMFIEQVEPDIDLPIDYIVVHTTGGDATYRTYPHMDVVLKGICFPAIQLGSPTDIVCRKAIDFRGKLSFRESAWIVAHAKGAIVVDSFMSHLCGALGTPVVVLYGPAPARVVGPRIQNNGSYIALEPNMLDVCKSMTRCWGLRRRMGINECISPCIQTLNPLSIRKAFLSMMEQ